MAGRPAPLDPRLAIAAAPPAEGDTGETSVRPVVSEGRAGVPTYVIVAGFLAAAVILFLVLDGRRRAQTESTADAEDSAFLTSAPPPLQVPPAFGQGPAIVTTPGRVSLLPRPRASAPVAAPQPPTIQYVPQPYPAPPQRASNGPSVVVDTANALGVPAAAQAGGEGQPNGGPFGGPQAPARVRSSVLANRSTTVVQGTLIPAVLETAFDSRRPGFARAIVSDDVRGFDGRQVLIPRGSRLVGEYRSDISPGQNRALINWVRLIRPDGATIAISSPAADTLGGGGVPGDYDSHFLERFGEAILQTALQIGANVISQEAGGAVVVALPSTTAAAGSLSDATRIVPSLTVRGGTTIAVFVARDLDFSQAERER